MNKIKAILRNWDILRIARVVFAGVLFIAYANDAQVLYLIGGLILLIQAVFNLSCPTGNCSTPTSKDSETPLIKTEKYSPKK